MITDGEQRKSGFATYPLEALTNLAPDGVVIPFKDGQTRQLPRLTGGLFRFGKAKIRARVEGTALAASRLGVR